ncbi:unnamed protein product, partial [Acanthoscelides obtectus]
MEEIMDSYTAENETKSIETQIAPPSENKGLLEEQVIEEPSPNLTGKTGSRVEAGLKNKKAWIEALAAAVAEIRKVQETITSNSISDHEAFDKFIAASLNKLPAVDSIMAQ